MTLALIHFPVGYLVVFMLAVICFIFCSRRFAIFHKFDICFITIDRYFGTPVLWIIIIFYINRNDNDKNKSEIYESFQFRLVVLSCKSNNGN